MEICRNKTSGQYFIYIAETGDSEALLITPEARVKSLKLFFFDDVIEMDEAYLLQSKLITNEQSERFHEYEKDRLNEIIENTENDFDHMNPYE